jgi:hypothetical protein
MRLSTSHIGIAIVKRERGVLATGRARENQERWRFFERHGGDVSCGFRDPDTHAMRLVSGVGLTRDGWEDG